MCCGEPDRCLSVGGQLTAWQDWQQWSFLAMKASVFKRIIAFWLRSMYLRYCTQTVWFDPWPCRMSTSRILSHETSETFNLPGGPKIIDWPPLWGAQLSVCVGVVRFAEVALIHRLSQETSAWLTSSLTSPKGVLSIHALLMSYVGRYSCEAAIPQEQKYCQS